MSQVVNARIVNTTITMENNGVLTFYITLKGDGWGVNYGGFVIANGYVGSQYFTAENGGGLVAMMKIMDTVGVSKWEDLNGKYIRAVVDGWGERVKVIGNIISDKWFNIDEFFETYGKEDESEEKTDVVEDGDIEYDKNNCGRE